MAGIDNDRYGVGESDEDIERKESLKSDQPEPTPENASGSDESDTGTPDNTNYKLEEMNRKGAKGRRICDISCLSGGILGTLGIAACTVAVCIFFSGAGSPLYAISFPNGSTVGSATSYVDADGRTNYDIELDGGNGGDPGNENNNSNGGDNNNSNGSEAGNKDHGPGSQPGYGGDNNGDNGNSGGRPGGEVPDTGEPSGERVTALMESELLRAQQARIDAGKERYLSGDLEISLAGTDIKAVADIYGFSEDFALAYNGISGSVPDIIRLPNV